MTRERFIPFRRASIVQMCTDDLLPEEQAAFRRFVELLSSLIHHRFRSRLEALKGAYAPFDPDADTRTIADTAAQDREQAADVLVDELTSLLEDANFELVGTEELDRAFVEETLLKVRLDVDFDDFEAVVFYRRGQQVREGDVSRWFGLRRETVSFVNYPKVLVYVRFKDADHFGDQDLDELPFEPGSTIIKLFQNVPRADLEMLFPNVKVRMRPFDKLLIGVPAVISGIIVFVTKLVTSLGVLFLLAAFWLGLRDQEPVLDEAALISIGAGMAALGGFLVRQVTKFKNRKIAFMKALSENLYFRNLDNDAGVFHHLLDAAEEEEVKEAVLAYHFLRVADAPLDPAELDHRIEAWLAGTWGTSIDFEIDDGLDKLRELHLVEEVADGRLTAVELAEASRRLDHVWDNLFRFNEDLAEVDRGS